MAQSSLPNADFLRGNLLHCLQPVTKSAHVLKKRVTYLEECKIFLGGAILFPF